MAAENTRAIAGEHEHRHHQHDGRRYDERRHDRTGPSASTQAKPGQRAEDHGQIMK
jgi:hypothetical protein